MCIINSDRLRVGLLATALALLTGCGVTQSVMDTTASVTNAIFYKQIKVLHLDFVAREAVNTDSRETGSWSVPVLVRVCQLKQRETFDALAYADVLAEGDDRLKADLLGCRDVTVRPGGGASLNMPMEKEAQFVAVMGLFRDPDLKNDGWRTVLERNQLDPDKARVIELEHGALSLLAVKEK